MRKLLLLAILLASSPANGLLETFFRTENSCYTGCHSNYAASPVHLDACKKGCDFNLHNEDCATQCKSISADEEVQASCQVGCTLSRPNVDVAAEKPVIAIDPIVEEKKPEIVPANPEPERPPSIILIRLRERPSMGIPPMHHMFYHKSIQMLNEFMKGFQEKTNELEQSVRTSFEQHSQEFPKPPSFESLSELTNKIPIFRVSSNIRLDSSSESSEENKDQRPLVKEIKHIVKHPKEHLEPVNNRIQQLISNVRNEWNDMVRKQPKIPIWIFIAILLSSSAILWYMVMSLCHQTPSRRALSVRAQELVFHPYEYDVYEKEKIQPDDQPYDLNESLPIKVKLTNI